MNIVLYVVILMQISSILRNLLWFSFNKEKCNFLMIIVDTPIIVCYIKSVLMAHFGENSLKLNNLSFIKRR